MNIRYLTIIGILLLGIGGSVWYAQQPLPEEQAADTVSGYVTQTGAEGELVESAPTAPPVPSPSTATLSQEQSQPSHECERASLVVNGTAYAPCATGATVLDIMRELSSEGLVFSGKEYPGLGYFVESINGVKAGGSMYWSLYKNGGYSEFGASQAKVAPGDVFEWKLEKSY